MAEEDDGLDPKEVIREVEAGIAAEKIAHFLTNKDNKLGVVRKQLDIMDRLSDVDIRDFNNTDAVIIINALDYWVEHSLKHHDKEPVWVNLKCAFQLGYLMAKESAKTKE